MRYVPRRAVYDVLAFLLGEEKQPPDLPDLDLISAGYLLNIPMVKIEGARLLRTSGIWILLCSGEISVSGVRVLNSLFNGVRRCRCRYEIIGDSATDAFGISLSTLDVASEGSHYNEFYDEELSRIGFESVISSFSENGFLFQLAFNGNSDIEIFIRKSINFDKKERLYPSLSFVDFHC